MPKLKIEHDTETGLTSIFIDDEKLGLVQEISFQQKAEDVAPAVEISMFSMTPGGSAVRKVQELLTFLGKFHENPREIEVWKGHTIGISSSTASLIRS